MSLGIDQRMSKTFTVGDAMALNTASRAGALDVSVAGLSVAEQDMPRAASDIDAGAFRSSNAVIDPGNVSSNAVIDPGNVGGRDALVGDPTGHARVIRDIDPNDIRGDANDNLAASAAGRAGSLGTGGDSFRSAVRDVAPADLGGSQAATDEGQSTMGDRVITQAAGGETVRAVRDIAPNELRSATYSGDDASGPGYLASDNDAGSVSRIRDAEPYDTRGVQDPTSELTARHMANTDAGSLARTQDAPFGPDPDSAEAYSPSFHSGGQQDAFLSSGEAASYAGGASVTEDQVSDSVQALTPP